MKIRSTLFWILGAGATALLAFYVLFDKYEYFDFEPAQCNLGETALSVELIGSFDTQGSNTRGSPYFLRVEQVPEVVEGSPLVIREMSFLSTGTEGVVPSTLTITATPVALDEDTPTHIIEDLVIPFQDYFLMLTADDGSTFQCQIKTHYKSKWRLTFWDMLLSV